MVPDAINNSPIGPTDEERQQQQDMDDDDNQPKVEEDEYNIECIVCE